MSAELSEEDLEGVFTLMRILETDYAECWGCNQNFDVIELSWSTGLCPVCTCVLDEKKLE